MHCAGLRCIGCVLLGAVHVGHALVHGTPLDGGMIDAVLPQLDAHGVYLASQT